MMLRIHVTAILTMLVLSAAAVSTTARAGDASFSCVTNDKPYGRKYEYSSADGTLRSEDKVLKYKTLRQITIHQEESTCFTKDGRKDLASYDDTYLIELETKDSDQPVADQRVTLMFLCNDSGGAPATDDCTRRITKTKALYPTYRHR